MRIKFSFLTTALITVSSSCFANVQGMNSQQLAQFAQAQPIGNQSYHSQPQSYNSTDSALAQQKIDELDALIQSSYVNNSVSNTATSSYSLKGYNRNTPVVKREVKIHKNVDQDDIEVAPVAPVAQVAQVEQVAPVEPPETDANWITKVAQYDSMLIKEERRLLQSQPKMAAITHNQGYVKQNYQGPTVKKVSYSYPKATGLSYTGINPPSPNNRAPILGNSDFYAFKPASIDCVMEAARSYEVPAHVLLGIASQERGKNGQRVRNTNGSYDLGHFQLNTIHFKSDGVFRNIDINDAKWRGCYNAELAAWLLRKQLLRTNKSSDFWTRVAGYHSWTPSKNAIYRKSVRKYAEDWKVWLNKRNMSVL